MIRLIAIALVFWAGAASAETNSRQDYADDYQRSRMVRNIGFAEQGDAIVVRQRKEMPTPAPTVKPEQK